MIDVLLAHAQSEIEEALRRMMAMPKIVKPFVVIEELGGAARFVQFAGSEEETILFDVPALKISSRLPDDVTLTLCAESAIAVLVEHLGVPPSATLRIKTQSDSEPGDIN